MKKVEVIKCNSGDWEVLIVNGKIHYEGHSIPEFIWLDILSDLGFSASYRTITNEDMEKGNYE